MTSCFRSGFDAVLHVVDIAYDLRENAGPSKKKSKKINLLTQNVLEDTDGVLRTTLDGCRSTPSVSSREVSYVLLPSLYTDVRSILMVFMTFQRPHWR